MFFRKSSPSDLFPQEYASVQGCRSQVKRRGLRGRQGITGPAEPVGPTGATGVPGGRPSSALIFDRNTVDYGAAITHANNSSDFVIQEPGVYLVLFNGTIAPVSNASFPVSTLLYLTQDGTPVVGSGVHYTFQNAEEVANQSFTAHYGDQCPHNPAAGQRAGNPALQRYFSDHSPAGRRPVNGENG